MLGSTRKWLSLALSVALAWPVAAGEEQIPFEWIRQPDAILVRATVNGKSVHLILDTGATFTMLGPEVLGKASVPLKPSQFSIDGPGMIGEARFVEVKFQIAAKQWRNRIVLLKNFEQVSRAYGRRIDGILGQDILSEFDRVSIDFRNRKIILTD